MFVHSDGITQLLQIGRQYMHAANSLLYLVEDWGLCMPHQAVFSTPQLSSVIDHLPTGASSSCF
jgi:hypothetical protein